MLSATVLKILVGVVKNTRYMVSAGGFELKAFNIVATHNTPSQSEWVIMVTTFVLAGNSSLDPLSDSSAGSSAIFSTPMLYG